MFGLAEQVGRYVERVFGAVADDQYLAGACGNVDRTSAEHLELCRGYVGVSWTDDLLDSWDGLGAISESSNCLGTPNCV